MPATSLPPTDTALLRFALLVATVAVPATPRAAGLTLTREPGEDPTGAGAFYYRDKISGPLAFTGDDYALLRAIEDSTDRCQAIGLLLDTRPYPGAAWTRAYTGTFTCAECEWDKPPCTVSVTPTTGDGYQPLLDAWDVEYNLLATPGVRVGVDATLQTLGSSRLFVEFKRVDAGTEGDLPPDERWGEFLRNTSHINSNSGLSGTNNHDVFLFRYRLRAVPLIFSGGVYTVPDYSAGNWQVLPGSQDSVAHTVDLVKTPDIGAFRPYSIRTQSDWTTEDNFMDQPSRNRYGLQLLLLPCDKAPADYGFVNADYLKITGSGGGQSLGGIQSDDHPGCLNVRVRLETDRLRSIWWRFGTFHLSRCFRLRDGIYELLRATASGPQHPNGTYTPDPRLLALLPPSADLLGDFLTNPTNLATGETGAANELPRLLLSAGSDVKRYGASEPATRLLLSLKTLLTDLAALYDCGWFIDPATGWLRIEHRAYLETQQAAGAVLDLRTQPGALLPKGYTYRTQQLPRYEELRIASGQTLDPAGNDFGQAAIDYGPGGCTLARAGQNRVTRSTSRLTGDVTAAVLSGDTLPDSAVVLLAAGAAGRLVAANRPCSATSLLLRYHRYGRAAAVGTVGTTQATIASVRRPRVQEGQRVGACSLSAFAATTRYTGSLGPGGQLAKASLALDGAGVTLSLWVPVPASTTPPPTPTGRQFSDQFSDQFA